MRTGTITKTYKTFNELNKEEKEKVIENFDHEGWLYEFNMQERIETLKALANLLDGELNYSFSCVTERGEFIKIIPRYDKLNFKALWEVIHIGEDCPFTGVYYDMVFIDKFVNKDILDESKALDYALNEYIKSIHDEYESMLSVDYIGDLCEANDYEFDADTLEMV